MGVVRTGDVAETSEDDVNDEVGTASTLKEDTKRLSVSCVAEDSASFALDIPGG